MTTLPSRKRISGELWEVGAIVVVCVLGACAYGIVHDLITAHVCLEYFSVAHAPLIQSDSPIVHAFFWGIIATWWVGVPLGVMNALACRLGKANKWTFKMFWRLLIKFLGLLLLLSSMFGILGIVTYRFGAISMPERFVDTIPNHPGFMYNAWSHAASYGFGILGSLCIHYWIIWKRLSGEGNASLTE